jgi:hypothetical protein
VYQQIQRGQRKIGDPLCNKGGSDRYDVADQQTTAQQADQQDDISSRRHNSGDQL